MAHKKAAGSAKNLRDSKPKYRGVKLFGWQKTIAGNAILKQKWSKYESGENTYVSKDFTIHAKVDGVVAFRKKKVERFDGRKYLKTVVFVTTDA
jgi:large subunit ribosomal protein L27